MNYTAQMIIDRALVVRDEYTSRGAPEPDHLDLSVEFDWCTLGGDPTPQFRSVVSMGGRACGWLEMDETGEALTEDGQDILDEVNDTLWPPPPPEEEPPPE